MDPARLTAALWGNGYAPENDAISYGRQVDRAAARDELVKALGGTWPVQMAKSAVGAAALPGDVYAGRVDPMSQQGIERAADLAGFTTLGSFAAPRPAGSIGMGGMPEKPGIRAYHGSPHDFDKFDLSKIGTGEGAQAYGHGLYFAESEGVAKSYRDTLAKGFSGADGAPLPRDMQDALEYILPKYKASGDYEAGLADAIGRMKDQAEFYRKAYGGGSNLYDSALERLQAIKPEQLKPAGKMYEVNIRANPDDFLDWDKPLRDQPQSAIRGLQERGIVNIDENLGPSSAGVIRPLGDFENVSSLSGEKLYRRLIENQMQGLDRKGGELAASRTLNEAGIPGIKYLDQGSRAAGDGSRNYVVFDDKLIEILRKYGLTGLLGLGAAGGAYQSQTQEGGS